MSSQISRSAAKFFWIGKPFRERNTVVTVNGCHVSLELHGNVIAAREGNRFKVRTVKNTQTTRARLSALMQKYSGVVMSSKGRVTAQYQLVPGVNDITTVEIAPGTDWTLIDPGSPIEQLAMILTRKGADENVI